MYGFCEEYTATDLKCASMLEMYQVALLGKNPRDTATRLVECYDHDRYPDLEPVMSQVSTRIGVIKFRTNPWQYYRLDLPLKNAKEAIRKALIKEQASKNHKCHTPRELLAISNIIRVSIPNPDCRAWARRLLASYEAAKVPQVKPAMLRLQSDFQSEKCIEAGEAVLAGIRALLY